MCLIIQVTDLLRAISFMKDLNFLAVFLREVLLTRYIVKMLILLFSKYWALSDFFTFLSHSNDYPVNEIPFYHILVGYPSMSMT